jgi:hypothetical protein
MEIIDGKGQLGTALKAIANNYYCDCIIYHTWNIEDHSEETQKNEFIKFIDFAEKNKKKRIIFISTKQGKHEMYLKYKLKTELYILENLKKGQIIRLPKLIGKGLFEKFRDRSIFPFDEMEEIMTLEKAALEIMNALEIKDKLISIKGEWVNKKTICSLIWFGNESKNI